MTLHAFPNPDMRRRAQMAMRYDGRAPRYTSYPTAVQFTPAVDAATYRSWLAALPHSDPVSLYVHVPLCARLCWYCGCNTRAVNGRQPVSDYVDHLLDEIGLLKSALPDVLAANAIHLGGGTPNLLSPEDLARLFAGLKSAFKIDEDTALAAELDPSVLTREWARAAAKHGLARASLGVQDLSPKVQAAVNRHEPFEVVERAVGWLREAGVASINLDLMYGLPQQTTREVLSTLDALLTLRPDRLAVFGYAHVPWMKPHQRLIDEADLPQAEARIEQAAVAAERLVAEGYVRVGLDHFALPDESLALAQTEGRLHRNFQGYTPDPASTLIGVGASAIGRLPQGYVQNLPQEVAWRAALRKGELPVARGVALTADDRFRADIIERLMCDFEVDLAQVCRRHGLTVESLASAYDDLVAFQSDGLLTLTGDRLEMTEFGRPAVRTVATVFDAYFDPDGQRHAKAL